ncbi:hypothetical protein NA57DRAFT_74207 [Rhizodiscina lignyota]|uniref:DUF7727 domain-containing protein n=1 Tax=Rhizodiscina lignyota TaxID=1504668 RepID=A0A9P4IJX6_9PEZI|nr:hypothetical protein NA57DRAFT_74207 [Rhizodiscina lignyota]
MGRLIKNHLARLIILAASFYQFAASLEGFFWPKMFFDFLTTNLNRGVTPVPILQIFNLVFSIVGILYEWPLKWIAGSAIHRSIEARLIIFPLHALAAVLMYQSTNAALYLMIGVGMYFWAYSEGEVVCEEPWSLPRRQTPRTRPQMITAA